MTFVLQHTERTYGRDFRPQAAQELQADLEPLATTHRGFESRPAPLTVDELRAVWSAERARAGGAL